MELNMMNNMCGEIDLPFQGAFITAPIVPGCCPDLNSAGLSARRFAAMLRVNPVDYRDAYSLKG